MFQRGDHIHHRPSGEIWVVKRVTETHVEPCGWPPSAAAVTDCDLIMTATAARKAGKWTPPDREPKHG